VSIVGAIGPSRRTLLLAPDEDGVGFQYHIQPLSVKLNAIPFHGRRHGFI